MGIKVDFENFYKIKVHTFQNIWNINKALLMRKHHKFVNFYAKCPRYYTISVISLKFNNCRNINTVKFQRHHWNFSYFNIYLVLLILSNKFLFVSSSLPSLERLSQKYILKCSKFIKLYSTETQFKNYKKCT